MCERNEGGERWESEKCPKKGAWKQRMTGILPTTTGPGKVNMNGTKMVGASTTRARTNGAKMIGVG